MPGTAGSLPPVEERVTAPDEAPPSQGDPGSGASSQAGRSSNRVRGVIEWVVVVGGAIVLALLIQTFLVQAFYIPSPSMESTLVENDRVLVNKLAYRFGDVGHGDVVVFERPPGEDGIKDLIKRVIAVEGDSLVIEGGVVSIDGQPIDEPYLDEGTFTTESQGIYDPTDPSGTLHRCVAADPCVVPEGYVFVMGDNRSNSRDSRFVDVGYIEEDSIVGRAFVRIWPLDRLGGL